MSGPIVPFEFTPIRYAMDINPLTGWRSVDEATFNEALYFYDWEREGYANGVIYKDEKGNWIGLRFDTKEPKHWLAPEVFKQNADTERAIEQTFQDMGPIHSSQAAGRKFFAAFRDMCIRYYRSKKQ